MSSALGRELPYGRWRYATGGLCLGPERLQEAIRWVRLTDQADRIAVDLLHEGIIDRSTALRRLEPYDLDSVVRVAVRPGPNDVAVGQAVPAGIGAATGEVVFDAKRVQELCTERDVVLVRSELDTDDIAGLSAAVES